MKKNKNGFTLIELLAVIIILGILMIIAIPSVTKYISDSRKSAYVDTAKELVSGTRNLVNEGNLGMYSTDTTYYIPAKYIKTESGTKSPYGEFTEAYIGVIYDGKGYEYFWISTDDAGEGVENVTKVELLDTDDIKSDLKSEDILNTVRTTGIGNRPNILILDSNGNWSNSYATENYVGEDGSIIVYPTGKTKETVVPGDKVIIGTEQFYVVSNNGTDLVLIARYNLKVGLISDSEWEPIREYSSSDAGYGMQSSEAKGFVEGASTYNGTIAYSSTNFWNGKVGSTYSGMYCTNNTQTGCANVFDSNSNLYQYVTSYKTAIENMGVTVKSARLITWEELIKWINTLGYSDSRWDEVSYWTSTPSDSEKVWYVHTNHDATRYPYFLSGNAGIRPVIVL